MATTIIINDTYGEYVDQGGEKPGPVETEKVTVTAREGSNTLFVRDFTVPEGATSMAAPYAGDGYVPPSVSATMPTATVMPLRLTPMWLVQT